MDDTLKQKIAASLDLPSDAAADPDVARAIDTDPAARDYARALHTVDAALKRWPVKTRSDAAWDSLASRIEQRLAEGAKTRKGKKVSRDEADPAAVPVFEDDSAPPRMESKQAMSEPQDHDADLEGLAALTRTSNVPPTMPVGSVRPKITDEVDDTSSGIVDIKALAAMAKDVKSTPPEPAPAPAPAAEAKPAEAPKKSEADAKAAAKKDDVMVTPSRTAVPIRDEAPRRGGNTWLGMVGGLALAAGAFAIYSNVQRSGVAENAASPPAAEAPAEPQGAAPTPTAPATATATATPAPTPPEAPPVAMAAPTEAPAPPPAQPVAAPEAVVGAGPTPTAVAAAIAPSTGSSAPPEDERRTTVARGAAAAARAPAPAREAAREPAPTPTTPARTQAAAAPAAPEAAPPPAPPPPARPAAAPTAAAAPGGGATPSRSVDDLMNRITGGNQPAAPPPPTAAPDVPERLNRSAATAVLTGLSGAVRACAHGQTGTAPVAIVIINDGTVSQANVTGQFAGTPVAECISGVVRRAHFPPFRAGQANITYPYVILPPRPGQ